jgi:hypothetical protein
MLKRVPDDLPLFGALAGGFGFLAFGFTGMFAEVIAGRPSSTASLGVIFIPVWAALFGFAGLLIGTLVQTIWLRLKPTSPEITTKGNGLRLALLAIIIGSSLLGVASVLIYEAGSKPTVMFDSGVVSASTVANTDTTIRKSAQLYGGSQSPQKNLTWGQNDTQIVVDGLDVRLSDRKRSMGINLKASGLDYINYVHAASFISSANQNPFLVVVITGRATGDRALIGVLDSDYRILYQSRIERYWPIDSGPLEIRRSANSHDEMAVIGPSCDEPLILKMR